jgi:hypothetical protein
MVNIGQIGRLLANKLTIGFIILIIHLFLLTNADFLFGAYAESAYRTLSIYMLFTVFALAAFAAKLPLIESRAYGFFIMILSFHFFLYL